MGSSELELLRLKNEALVSKVSVSYLQPLEKPSQFTFLREALDDSICRCAPLICASEVVSEAQLMSCSSQRVTTTGPEGFSQTSPDPWAPHLLLWVGPSRELLAGPVPGGQTLLSEASAHRQGGAPPREHRPAVPGRQSRGPRGTVSTCARAGNRRAVPGGMRLS